MFSHIDAMENWGLSTYRETFLLVDEKHTPAQSRQLTAAMIGHELAHQWFGNLVTMVSGFIFYIFMFIAAVLESLFICSYRNGGPICG